LAQLSDLVIAPYQRMLNRPSAGSGMVGGPVFAWDETRTWLRHCAHGIARDSSGDIDEVPLRLAGTWLYAGPITDDFSHYAAEFIHRLPIGVAPPVSGIVMSSSPSRNSHHIAALPEFASDALRYLGLQQIPVRIIRSAVQVESAIILAQGEQLGVGARPEYLMQLVKHQQQQFGSSGHRGKPLYLSRAGLHRGKLAGESYLERWLADAGVLVIRPESVPWPELLHHVHESQRLLLSEGGAAHALSLLGSLPESVHMLSRRRSGSRGRLDCAIPLAARSMGGIHEIDAIIDILDPVPLVTDDLPNALTLVDPQMLFAELHTALEGFGSVQWSMPEFIAAAEADLESYLSSYYVRAITVDDGGGQVASQLRNRFAHWLHNL
jgi:hypothetical protein